MRKSLTALALGAFLVAPGCDGTQTDAPSEVGQTALLQRSIAADAAETNAALETLARAVAAAMADGQARQALHAAVAERFDGAPNVLLSRVLIPTASKGDASAALRTAVASALAAQSRSTPEGASRALAQMATAHARIQIAVPVLFSEWNPAEQVPVVAVVPEGVPEDEIETYRAFDADGNALLLDAKTDPDRPVVVVSLNERVDETGVLRPIYAEAKRLADEAAALREIELEPCEFGQIDCDTPPPPPPPPPPSTNVRTGAHLEKLHRVAIYDDHEGWGKEPAELNVAVYCPGSPQPLFKSLLGDPEPEDVMLYAGIKNNRYDFEQYSYNLNTVGITYFTWDPASVGALCVHNMWEDDGGGTTTTSVTIPASDGFPAVTVSDTRPVNNADMGNVTFLYSDPLSTRRRTSDYELQMK